MRRTVIARLALLALAVSAAGAARPARAGGLYILKDLGTLGGTNSYGQAVNDSGQVAGYSLTSTFAVTHAFLSGPGGSPLKDLGALGGTNSSANAVKLSLWAYRGSTLERKTGMVPTDLPANEL
jgi:probable HAF family extracellular repeat protein